MRQGRGQSPLGSNTSNPHAQPQWHRQCRTHFSDSGSSAVYSTFESTGVTREILHSAPSTRSILRTTDVADSTSKAENAANRLSYRGSSDVMTL